MREKVKLITEISKSAYDTIMARSVLTPNEAAKAIDAILNSTPLTESNDAVSREEVCSIANGLKDYCVSMYNPNDASETEIINYIYKYVDALYDLPSVVKREPKLGHWIPLGNYDDWGNENSYKCSECGEVSDYPDNYCRECGTKMESEKTE